MSRSNLDGEILKKIQIVLEWEIKKVKLRHLFYHIEMNEMKWKRNVSFLFVSPISLVGWLDLKEDDRLERDLKKRNMKQTESTAKKKVQRDCCQSTPFLERFFILKRHRIIIFTPDRTFLYTHPSIWKWTLDRRQRCGWEFFSLLKKSSQYFFSQKKY